MLQVSDMMQAACAPNSVTAFLPFIINPDSFSQTVENLFYFSFLIKEGIAAVEMDDDQESEFFGEPIVCKWCSPPT